MNFISKNPFNGEIIGEYPVLDRRLLDSKLEKSEMAFHRWKNTSIDSRSKLLENVATLLNKDIDRLSRLITLEMGKSIHESRAEIQKCASVCRFYATEGVKFLYPELIPTEAKDSGVIFDPIGCVFGIMPWNFPFWQVFRFVAPSLLGGNVCLLKHAPNVMGCATAIEEIIREAGFEEGVFQNLVMDLDLVELVIASDIVCGIAFTGSEVAGAKVASMAGKHLKKVVMELGGSDPFIVLSDANLEKAAEIGVSSRMMNAGQACNGAKRFIVEQSVYERFLNHFVEKTASLIQGNPLEENGIKVNMGPLARIDLAQKLESQWNKSLAMGAKIALQGNFEGCNVSPMILSEVNIGMPVFDEETFGPLAAIIPAKDADEAIRLANHHRYGLAASLWTQNLSLAKSIIPRLEVGNVFVNSMVRSDPRLPFGGIKKSGFGRELSKYGLREFLNIKTYYLEA